MSVETNENCDINSIFDNIALSENNVQREGFEEGLKKGERDGAIEGFHVGFHKGIDVGAEVGFYCGAVEAWLAVSNNKKIPERAKLVLLKLKDLLQQFPLSNDPNVDILSLIDRIRAKYKMVCSLLKVEPYVPYSGGFSF